MKHMQIKAMNMTLKNFGDERIRVQRKNRGRRKILIMQRNIFGKKGVIGKILRMQEKESN